MISDKSLDEALTQWARQTPSALKGGTGDSPVLLRIYQYADTIADQPKKRRQKLWLPAGLAAAASFVLVLSQMSTDKALIPTIDVEQTATVQLAEVGDDTNAAFALLYTMTAEEEYQL